MKVFPVIELSDTEKNLLAEALQAPVIQKYLQSLCFNIGADIVMSLPDPTQEDSSWLKKELYLKGQLAALNELLEIKPLPKQ